MTPLVGNYLGIVVQNNDPKKRGRVKVWVPSLSMNLYEDWDELKLDDLKSVDAKSFVNLSDDFIKDVVEPIKLRLPWANCAAPIVGEVGASYFNPYDIETKTGDDPTREGNKPAKVFEDSPETDEFDTSYQPTPYNNSAKGLFSIPKVGSRVWVFFEAGNINRPVYFATSYSQSDWSGINAGSDYPAKAENFAEVDSKDGSYDPTYKNKMVISQKGGAIEIVNTDSNEKIGISHYNGSFKVWTNDETKEFVQNDDKKLVMGSANRTVREDDSLHVDGNKTENIEGNKTITIKGSKTLTVSGDGTITVTGDVTISVDGTIDITCPTTNVTGDVNVSGDITVTGGDVVADGVSLKTHVHSGVTSGPNPTGPPV